MLFNELNIEIQKDLIDKIRGLYDIRLFSNELIQNSCKFLRGYLRINDEFVSAVLLNLPKEKNILYFVYDEFIRQILLISTIDSTIINLDESLEWENWEGDFLEIIKEVKNFLPFLKKILDSIAEKNKLPIIFSYPEEDNIV